MPLFVIFFVLWRRYSHRFVGRFSLWLTQACEQRAARYARKLPGRLNSVERRWVAQARSNLNAASPLRKTALIPPLYNPQENDMSDINAKELALWRTAGFEHLLIDVRRDIKRAAEGDEISGGQWHNPADWLNWKDAVAATAPGQPMVVYCAYGHELSQALAVCLRALGRDARHLVGGIDEWRKAGLPVAALQ